MIAQGGGHIVNTTSAAGLFGAAGGVTLFVLTVARVLWGVLADRGPASFAGQRRWDHIAERTVRVLLYVAVFSAIGSGVARS